MIELHSHTFFSDGVLSPSEMVRRYLDMGYKGVVLSDHADASNLEFVITSVQRACDELRRHWEIVALAGVELTHAPVASIPELLERAREFGASIVAVHGETITEPVEPGTNAAALMAHVDFLAHPGLISEQDALMAAKLGIPLEITTRRGHAYTNGHVAATARRTNAALVINNDAHGPGDILGEDQIVRIALGAGLTDEEIREAFAMSARILRRGWERLGIVTGGDEVQ